VNRLKAKSASLAAYAMIAGLSAVCVYFGTSCWPVAAYNPEVARPIRPERFSAKELGPSAKDVAKALTKRGEGWESPDDSIE
jgi:hypothetical protein